MLENGAKSFRYEITPFCGFSGNSILDFDKVKVIWVVSYFYKQVAFLRVFLLKNLHALSKFIHFLTRQEILQMHLCSDNIWTKTLLLIDIENILRLVFFCFFLVLLWPPKIRFDWWFIFLFIVFIVTSRGVSICSAVYIYIYIFIFHNTIFRSYPENHDTKEGFCFLKQGTKTKFFLAVKLKKWFQYDAHFIFIKTVMLLLFFSLLWIDIARIVFKSTELCFKSAYY